MHGKATIGIVGGGKLVALDESRPAAKALIGGMTVGPEPPKTERACDPFFRAMRPQHSRRCYVQHAHKRAGRPQRFGKLGSPPMHDAKLAPRTRDPATH